MDTGTTETRRGHKAFHGSVPYAGLLRTTLTKRGLGIASCVGRHVYIEPRMSAFFPTVENVWARHVLAQPFVIHAHE